MSTTQIALPVQHVTMTPGVCGGKPCIAGTRVRVWDIAVRAQGGRSPDEILCDFPRLTLGDIYGALAFFYDNREAMEQQAIEDDQLVEAIRQRVGPGPLETANSGKQRTSTPTPET